MWRITLDELRRQTPPAACWKCAVLKALVEGRLCAVEHEIEASGIVLPKDLSQMVDRYAETIDYDLCTRAMDITYEVAVLAWLILEGHGTLPCQSAAG